jgi:cephalosporin-C deacetylase-like acetyl esterase
MFDSLISPSTQFAAYNAATEALKLKVTSFLGGLDTPVSGRGELGEITSPLVSQRS